MSAPMRTRCNACGDPLPGARPSTFLCRGCVQLVPAPMMLRYRRACRAALLHRRSIRRSVDPVPHRINVELAAAWRACADAARAAYSIQRRAA